MSSRPQKVICRPGSVLPVPLRPGEVESAADAKLRADVLKGLALRQGIMKKGIEHHVDKLRIDVMEERSKLDDTDVSEDSLIALEGPLVQYAMQKWKQDDGPNGLAAAAVAVASLPFPAASVVGLISGANDDVWLLPKPAVVDDGGGGDGGDDDYDDPDRAGPSSTNARLGRPAGTHALHPGRESKTKFARDDGSECAFCFENRVLVLLIPCRHICLCSKCARHIMTNGDRRCLICQRKIQQVIEHINK